MKQRNDFLLPDELGWECNDEINKVFKQHISKLMKYDKTSPWMLDVLIANIMDDMYAIIKKYQKKNETPHS